MAAAKGPALVGGADLGCRRRRRAPGHQGRRSTREKGGNQDHEGCSPARHDGIVPH